MNVVVGGRHSYALVEIRSGESRELAAVFAVVLRVLAALVDRSVDTFDTTYVRSDSD